VGSSVSHGVAALLRLCAIMSGGLGSAFSPSGELYDMAGGKLGDMCCIGGGSILTLSSPGSPNIPSRMEDGGVFATSPSKIEESGEVELRCSGGEVAMSCSMLGEDNSKPSALEGRLLWRLGTTTLFAKWCASILNVAWRASGMEMYLERIVLRGRSFWVPGQEARISAVDVISMFRRLRDAAWGCANTHSMLREL